MDSFYAAIVVDGANNAHVVWHDRTDYLGSGADRDIFYKRFGELPVEPSGPSEPFDMVIIILTASIIGGIGLAIVITIILIRKRK